jgi:hypothetical protein
MGLICTGKIHMFVRAYKCVQWRGNFIVCVCVCVCVCEYVFVYARVCAFVCSVACSYWKSIVTVLQIHFTTNILFDTQFKSCLQFEVNRRYLPPISLPQCF